MIFVHIGLRKTGTTSIQHFVAGNIDLLARHNIHYPAEGRERTAHHSLTQEFKVGRDDTILKQTGALFAAHPERNFLISAEGLSTLPPEAVRRFIATIASHHTVKIILYVRNLSGLIVSSYNQNTKRGFNVLSFDESYAVRGRGRENMFRVVEIWGEAAGFDAIRVRTLEPAALVGGALLPDLCAALGLAEDFLGETDPASQNPTNVSVSWEAAEYVRRFTLLSAAALTNASEAEDRKVAPYRSKKKVRGSARRGASEPVSVLRLRNLPVVCQAALDRDGKGARAQYMTSEQTEKLEASYRAQLDRIAALVPDAKLDNTVPATQPERPFEPDFDHIPQARRDVMLEAVRTTYGLETLPPLIRGILETMHGKDRIDA